MALGIKNKITYMFKHLFSVLVIVLIYGSFFSCNEKSSKAIDSKCQRIISDFFNQIGTENYNTALDKLLRSNRNINIDDSATLHLKEGFTQINVQSGKFIGYSLLKSRVIENDIAIYTYLVKYEAKFYRFVFVFYQPYTIPVIYRFAYDNGVDIELEESIKLYVQ